MPFLGGFGGRVFAEDGITPTLDTEAMVSALTFLNDLKFVHGVMPVEADYKVADDLFKSGKAAMIINGDWTLGSYAELFGRRAQRLPDPADRRRRGLPKPYAAGTFFMVSKAVADDPALQAAVIDFVKFATGKDNQVEQLADA